MTKKQASSPASTSSSNGPSSVVKSRPSTDSETNRRAAIILEVLAGIRSPSDAAESLKISVNYYYVLERKAVQGLVTACRPSPKGPPGPTVETQLTRLKRELEQCRHECQRQSALVRATERAIGIPASSASKTTTKKDGKSPPGKRRRKPVVRALQAAATLRENSALENSPDKLETAVTGKADRTTTSVNQEESCDGKMRQEAVGGSSS